jgi:hypothetical protein
LDTILAIQEPKGPDVKAAFEEPPVQMKKIQHSKSQINFDY